MPKHSPFQNYEALATYFNNRVKNFGASTQALQWKSRQSQRIRFDVIYNELLASCKSIVDIGCGCGDFYDFYWLDDKHLGVVVGDVSGKGVPAALMMAVCKTLLKSRASADLSTASIVTHVNVEMARDNKNYMFVTVFMAILNTETGALTYTNAGHNPTYIKKKNGSMVKLMDLHGPVVAAMEGMTYKETKTSIEVGDFIFCYTDGVTEAHNTSNELFTDKKLNDLLEYHSFSSTKQMVCDIVDATLEFTGEAEQFDDITALSIEYKTNYHG